MGGDPNPFACLGAVQQQGLGQYYPQQGCMTSSIMPSTWELQFWQSIQPVKPVFTDYYSEALRQIAESEARLEQQRRAHLAEIETHKKYQFAEMKARVLLMRFLDNEQQQSWETESRFVVRAKSGRRYRIGDGVVRLDKHSTPDMSYCIYSCEHLPRSDKDLANLLMLKHSEAEFLRIAVATPTSYQPRRERYSLAAQFLDWLLI